MNPHDSHRTNVRRPSYSDGQWSPPLPQFQEHDKVSEARSTSQTYSISPPSPPHVFPPVHEDLNEIQQMQSHPAHTPHALYQQGYSTEKEAPTFAGPNVAPQYSTEQEIPKFATSELMPHNPDYSAPEVVPEQFSQQQQHAAYRGQVFPPPSHGGGASLASRQGRPYTFKEHVGNYDASYAEPAPVPAKDDRKCGMRKRNFLILMGCATIAMLALALGLGLGLGLGSDEASGSSSDSVSPFCRQQPQYCIGGALDANYYSKKGVFNGTGIALAGESWNIGQRRIFTLYFQHHTGDIRYMQYTTDRSWIGGTANETVATDAKNASPISAVSVNLNHTTYFHIFYIDRNNTVRQVTRTNSSGIWQPGPLSALNLKAMDSPSSGLQACWKGNYYGDSDYSKFPTANGQINTQPYDERLGMNIWFATDANTFQQYAWYNGAETWVSIQQWSGFNAHAGVGCYSWGAGTTTYTMLANRANNIEFWWKDTNTTTKSTESHPINSWQNASHAAIPAAHAMTSLGFTTYFYAQAADRSIKGYNITYQAENTTFVPADTFTITNPAGPAYGLAGTHMSVTAYAERRGSTTLWDSLYVFYQTQGNDITAFTRPIAGGEWTSAELNIPDV
ncbi:hypothetical protein ACEQ8H_007664 [Pleosporales sp. CAS-2024a]